MNSEQLQMVIHWLNEQINYTNNVINDAHCQNNFGREAQYEGMRDAFHRCLNKLKSN